MDWFKLSYTLLGGLGLFFYGMTQLSESLQAIAGDVMKRAINILTKNRFIAVFVGLVITMIIQSSSVTTVMLVGFVNAGLMTMTQACGVILGADIGTTITGWIIAIKVGKYGLALIGVGIFPMIFSKNDFWKSFGKLCFALGLVFYGLQLMSVAFRPLRSHEGFLSILSYFTADSLPSVLGCVLVGGFVTAVIQSSSATLGITIAMAMTGVIPFQTAAALVLGENIGTTITAYLASMTGNTNAKRTAYAHIMFKVIGVCIVVIIFYPYIKFVDWLVYGAADAVAEDGSKPYIATHIAAAHTIFNVAITCFFLPFIKYIVKLVMWMVPESNQKEPYKLSFLGSTHDMSPELAIEQAHRAVARMAGLVSDMANLTKDFIVADKNEREISAKITKYEQITDNIQKEVHLFFNKVLSASMPEALTEQASGIIRASDELESIADYFNSLVQYRKRLFENKEILNEKKTALIVDFVDDTIEFFEYTLRMLSIPDSFSMAKCLERYTVLNEKGDNIRRIHLKKTAESAEGGSYTPLAALTFSDMIVALRRVKNHSLNLAEALSGGKANR